MYIFIYNLDNLVCIDDSESSLIETNLFLHMCLNFQSFS